MWEIIRTNKRKSFFLFLIMGIVLLFLGGIAGAALLGQGGEYIGMFFAVVLWIILSLISYFSGSKILLSISGAKEVTKEVHPQLFNVVEEMSIAAGMKKMPKVYIINEQAPNAFATGKDPDNSAVAVTAGLLTRLNRDELQGVIAHEISHIINRDVAFMGYAGIMLGAIVLISEIFLHGLWFGGARRYDSRDSGGGQAQIVIVILSLLAAILAPILAQLLYFAISRKREYLADASGARLTRYPEGLASALEKISDNRYDMKSANKVTAGMYIVNPLKKQGMKLSDLSSTHPPISERVRILRGMMHGASFMDYQNAYKSVKGSGSSVIPKSELKQEKVDLRGASSDSSASKSAKAQKRDLGDLMMNVNKYLFLACVCGIKMKIPPTYSHSKVKCPRCGKVNDVPLEELAAISAIGSNLK